MKKFALFVSLIFSITAYATPLTGNYDSTSYRMDSVTAEAAASPSGNDLSGLEGMTAQCTGRGYTVQTGAAYNITGYGKMENGTLYVRTVASMSGQPTSDTGWRAESLAKTVCTRVFCAKTTPKVSGSVIRIHTEYERDATVGNTCSANFR